MRGWRDLRQRAVADRPELGNERVGPRASLGQGVEKAQRRAAPVIRMLLTEQELADLLALIGGQRTRLPRREHREPGVRAVVHGAVADVQQRGEIRIARVPAQQQRERSLLIGRQVV